MRQTRSPVRRPATDLSPPTEGAWEPDRVSRIEGRDKGGYAPHNDEEPERILAASKETMMARSAEKRGKDETKAAEKKVKATGKPAGGARGGITAPVTPSPELAEIVGKNDLPRSEVVSKVWDYIKKNNLQDEKDKRQINADDKLQKIFGKKSASMFEMNKHLSAHLSAKKA
jgi:chromatin remodeling complex protein RSC6